jgi:pyruvate dehydrogenase E2 component (dihydrolipoamide acetyltransferase)
MATEVMMPQVGQDIETATIVQWHKKENDTVNKGDIIATVESDKASFDVEAYDSGVLLKRLYEEGQEVKVLTPIAYLGEPGESVDEIPSAKAGGSLKAEGFGDGFFPATQPASLVSVDKSKGDTDVKASPSARRLAKEKRIDLKNVTGTGPGGRITKEDVLKACDDKEDTNKEPM